MKYFTPELLARFQSEDDSVADRADAQWERALQRYERRWNKIKERLPEVVRRFEHAKTCLHDAEVLCLARRGDTLVLVVQQPSPRTGLVVLFFLLDGEPTMHGDPTGARWLYEEFDLDRHKRQTFDVIFSNGAQLSLRFGAFYYIAADRLTSSAKHQRVTRNGRARSATTAVSKARRSQQVG